MQHSLEDSVPLLPLLSEIFPFPWEDNDITSELSGADRYSALKKFVVAILRNWSSM